MVKFVVFLFIISFASLANTESCYIETANQIYFIKNNNNLNFIKDSNCKKEIKKQFNLFITSSNGVMRANDVQRILLEQFNVNVGIEPQKIKTYDLAEYIKTTFSLSKNWGVDNVKLLENKPILIFDDATKLKAVCSNCEFTGSKQIKLVLNNETSSRYSVRWIKADINIRAKALVAKRSLFFNNKPLNPSDFEIQYIPTDRPEKYFTNIENIKFYKINKQVAKGKPIAVNDLTPVNLVRAGRPVELFFENTALKLKTRANPLNQGSIGEIIQLKSKNTNRVITGKVVDYNKVIVEL